MTIPSEKLAEVLAGLARDQGPFDLFGAFVREDAPEGWDLVMAASWLRSDDAEALRFIAGRVQDALSTSELRDLSRLVVLDEGTPFLEAVLAICRVEEGVKVLGPTELGGIAILKAWIFACSRRRIARDRRPRRRSAAG